MRVFAAALCLAVLVGPAYGQGLTVSAADTIPTVVAAQKGKRVTLRLRSGQELSGTVRESTERLVVLAEITGREFFDAVVPLDAIEAVIVRTR